MQKLTWGESPGTTLVCIDTWDGAVPEGRFYIPQAAQGRHFRGVTQFLQEMENALDQMEKPTAFSALRRFSAPRPASTVQVGSVPRMGAVANFRLRVLFRQNVSWQGSVAWLEGKQEESFRSVLELVLLISDALQTKKSEN